MYTRSMQSLVLVRIRKTLSPNSCSVLPVCLSVSEDEVLKLTKYINPLGTVMCNLSLTFRENPSFSNRNFSGRKEAQVSPELCNMCSLVRIVERGIFFYFSLYAPFLTLIL
jgi:hypothetical protein